MSAADYDLFLSHAWADGDAPQLLAEALKQAGLRVWFDATNINDFAGITLAVTEGLARSKALIAWYSKTYPTRRACQWELTAAYLAATSDGDPRRRILVINPEKGSDHIHPVELRDAKYSIAPTNDVEIKHLVDSIVAHVTSIKGPLADIRPLSAPSWHGMTPVGSTRFVGRLPEMWKIHSLLHAGDVAQVSGASAATGGIAQVQGLAGVGKSLLTEEYALRFGSAYPGGIFWLRAYGNNDTKAALGAVERETLRTSQVRQIAERLGIATEGREPDEIEAALGRHLVKEAKPCLWVVDDVPTGIDGIELRRWFAPNPLARTLLTTRSREYNSLAREVDLSVLTPEEALQLLTTRKKPEGSAEKEQAAGLASDLGCHALALDITASALQSYTSREPYRAFRDELSAHDEDALELATELADALPNGHEKSIAQTILRSIRNLGPEGQDLLRIAAFLAVAPLPGSLIIEVFQAADEIEPGEAEHRQRRAFVQATNASLAEVAGEHQEARSVHTLVSRTMRLHEESTPARAPAWLSWALAFFRRPAQDRTCLLEPAAVKVLTRRLAAVDHVGEHGSIGMDIPHALHLVANNLETGGQVRLASVLASVYHDRGDYASAKNFRWQALEVLRRVLGEEQPETIIAMSSLSATLLAQGNRAEARDLAQKALVTSRRVFGEDSPVTLAQMVLAAATLKADGDLNVAKELLDKALASNRRVFGEEHPNTLVTMNNLAVAQRELGDLSGALKMQQQVLATYRRVFGEEHPSTLAAINNLAGTLEAKGELNEARQLKEQVMLASRRVCGEDHPDTLARNGNLANSLREKGDLAEASLLHCEVLMGYRRLLGDDHTDTLLAMNNLAETLSSQGDFAAAGKLHEQLLEKRTRLFGEEHPNTLLAMNNLGSALFELGNLTEATIMQRRRLSVGLRVQGEEHPDTLVAKNNLAYMLKEQGDLTGAEQLQEEVLEVSRRVMGEDHPNTLTAINNLARTHKAQGNLSRARDMQQQVLTGRRASLGEEHPDTLAAMNNLAGALDALGEVVEAEDLLTSALQISRRVLGEEHPGTTRRLKNLAIMKYRHGNLAEAIKLQERLGAVRLHTHGKDDPETREVMNNLLEMKNAWNDSVNHFRSQTSAG